MNRMIPLLCCCVILTVVGCAPGHNSEGVCACRPYPNDRMDVYRIIDERNTAYLNALLNPPEYAASSVPYPNMSKDYAAYLRGAESGWREGVQGYNDITTTDLAHTTESPQFREGYARGLVEGKQYIANLKQLADEYE